MSQNPSTAAISLRPPAGLSATPDFGPLVRAQPIRPPVTASTTLWVVLATVVPRVARAISHSFVIELAGIATVAVAALLVGHLPTWYRRWRMWRSPAWDGSGPAPKGAVRVTGRLRAMGQPFLLPGEKQLVIYARTSYPQARSDGSRGKFLREDVRGLSLEIALPVGTSVRLAPESVRLLGSEKVVPEVGVDARWRLGAAWQGWFKGKLRRSSLREGDRVEAVGELVRDVSVEGTAAPGRGVPMVQWLVPAWPDGVWIRKLEAG